jgi:transposase
MLKDEQVKELKFAHKQTRDKRLADRIKAILMLHFGFTYEQIKLALLLDEVTLRRYQKQYKEKGIDGLLECHYGGGNSKLTLVQQQSLADYVCSHVFTTAVQVQKYVGSVYGKSYTLIGITKLLHRLGFTYKKPKIMPGNVSIAEQQSFLQIYQKTKEQLTEKDHIYFSDATHPTHNTKPSYGWIKKGKKNDVYIKSKKAVVIEEKTIDANAIIALCEQIKKKQPHGKVYLILDNAKYHHARLVNNWFLRHPRFKRIFLPAYSPNLNIIERLWRFFHQKVTNNQYFKTFQEFKEATMQFFQNLRGYKTELDTLLTENFQTLPLVANLS